VRRIQGEVTVRFRRIIAIAGLMVPCAVVAVHAEKRAVPLAPLTAVQEDALRPKDRFRECATCPEMVVVPAGSFTMGAPPADKDALDSEGPPHVVTIARPLAVGRLHATVDQFAAFVAETRYEASPACWTREGDDVDRRADRSWRNPGYAQRGTHPVVCVSFDDATAYADWLARKTGKPYRLLSEAEWEYAAHGSTLPGAYPRYWFGPHERRLCRYGNSADRKALRSIAWMKAMKGWTFARCDDGFAYTSPAGHYAPNAFGLYDMAGNAWQWTADCWHGDYNGAPADGSAWTTGCQGSVRVIRGGSWRSDRTELGAAVRGYDGAADFSLGFRVARTLVTTPAP
jgi:formylglycine-generating enzyme required for sulfatase activity